MKTVSQKIETFSNKKFPILIQVSNRGTSKKLRACPDLEPGPKPPGFPVDGFQPGTHLEFRPVFPQNRFTPKIES